MHFICPQIVDEAIAAGDRDAVQVRVGEGARLTIEPVAATVALPGPRTTYLELDVEVAGGGQIGPDSRRRPAP